MQINAIRTTYACPSRWHCRNVSGSSDPGFLNRLMRRQRARRRRARRRRALRGRRQGHINGESIFWVEELSDKLLLLDTARAEALLGPLVSLLLDKPDELALRHIT